VPTPRAHSRGMDEARCRADGVLGRGGVAPRQRMKERPLRRRNLVKGRLSRPSRGGRQTSIQDVSASREFRALRRGEPQPDREASAVSRVVYMLPDDSSGRRTANHLLHASRLQARGCNPMQQDDPGDSILALSPSSLSPLKQRNDWSDLCLMIADAIRLHVIAATPEQASDAAHETLQRLEDEGIEFRRR
jgi:hypothetical protein